MKLKNYLLVSLFMAFACTAYAQEAVPNVPTKADYIGEITAVHVSSIASRMSEITPAINNSGEANDRRSIRNKVIIGKDTQTEDDYYVRNRHEMEQSVRVSPPSVVFDAYSSNSQPTDPAMAVGPNHVFVVFNTGFTIYDKNGNQLLGQTSPNPAIFPSGGCCDLTASYDAAADRWVVSFLGSGVQVAVSDGPDPINDGWNVYNVPLTDYQKLSVWSDGYYLTHNTGSNNKAYAMERAEMLAGNSAGVQGFPLPGLVQGPGGFFSPQALNVSDANMPANGNATFVFLQDDAFSGIATDHIKYWTLNVDWDTPGNSVMSAATEIPVTPFIGVFDGGSFVNLAQPSGGPNIDALQQTIMNQAQFRKFGGYNSAIFNHVVDTDGTSGELAGIRWYEFRQTGDGQPWTLYQEGTYTAPDGRHAWHASMIMDGNGNIGMGYTSMSGPTTPTTVRVSSYYTGRFDGDPLGTMTVAEELIANGNANIPGTRYGDYSKMDIDPSDDSTFWFINEYMNSGRKGVVGAFELAPNTSVDDVGVTSIVSPVDGPLTNAEDIVINVRNFGINDIVDPEVQYTIDGGTPVVETYSGTIVSGATESYTFATQADLSGAGATYTIASRTNLTGDSDPSNDEATKDVTNGLIYCNPNLDCSFGDGFQLIAIEEINNPSGCEGYADFTDQVASFPAEGTYELTVTTGYGDQNVKAWIDFNDDGVFDVSEIVVENFVIAPGQAAGTYTETADLVIPAGANAGNHRMRFKSNWQAPVPDDACEETNFGEVEDYSAQVGTIGFEDQEIANADLIVTSLPNNQFKVTLVTEFDERASIGVYNVLGQLLAFNFIEKDGDRYVYDLDMSYAASGVYIIKIGNPDSNTYQSAKIIVK